MIPFVVPHFPLRDTVMADSILGVRAFGTENQPEGINDVINARMASMNTKRSKRADSRHPAECGPAPGPRAPAAAPSGLH